MLGGVGSNRNRHVGQGGGTLYNQHQGQYGNSQEQDQHYNDNCNQDLDQYYIQQSQSNNNQDQYDQVQEQQMFFNQQQHYDQQLQHYDQHQRQAQSQTWGQQQLFLNQQQNQHSINSNYIKNQQHQHQHVNWDLHPIRQFINKLTHKLQNLIALIAFKLNLTNLGNLVREFKFANLSFSSWNYLRGLKSRAKTITVRGLSLSALQIWQKYAKILQVVGQVMGVVVGAGIFYMLVKMPFFTICLLTTLTFSIIYLFSDDSTLNMVQKHLQGWIKRSYNRQWSMHKSIARFRTGMNQQAQNKRWVSASWWDGDWKWNESVSHQGSLSGTSWGSSFLHDAKYIPLSRASKDKLYYYYKLSVAHLTSLLIRVGLPVQVTYVQVVKGILPMLSRMNRVRNHWDEFCQIWISFLALFTIFFPSDSPLNQRWWYYSHSGSWYNSTTGEDQLQPEGYQNDELSSSSSSSSNSSASWLDTLGFMTYPFWFFLSLTVIITTILTYWSMMREKDLLKHGYLLRSGSNKNGVGGVYGGIGGKQSREWLEVQKQLVEIQKLLDERDYFKSRKVNYVRDWFSDLVGIKPRGEQWSKEHEIHKIFQRASQRSGHVLNALIQSCDLEVLLDRLQDRKERRSRSKLIEFLTQPEFPNGGCVDFLEVPSKALIIHALMVNRFSCSDAAESGVLSVITNTNGDDLSLLKSMTDSKGSIHGLHKLVYVDCSPETRCRILKHCCDEWLKQRVSRICQEDRQLQWLMGKSMYGDFQDEEYRESQNSNNFFDGGSQSNPGSSSWWAWSAWDIKANLNKQNKNSANANKSGKQSASATWREVRFQRGGSGSSQQSADSANSSNSKKVSSSSTSSQSKKRNKSSEKKAKKSASQELKRAERKAAKRQMKKNKQQQQHQQRSQSEPWDWDHQNEKYDPDSHFRKRNSNKRSSSSGDQHGAKTTQHWDKATKNHEPHQDEGHAGKSRTDHKDKEQELIDDKNKTGLKDKELQQTSEQQQNKNQSTSTRTEISDSDSSSGSSSDDDENDPTSNNNMNIDDDNDTNSTTDDDNDTDESDSDTNSQTANSEDLEQQKELKHLPLELQFLKKHNWDVYRGQHYNLSTSNRHKWNKILTDIDDTLYCSGGSFPKGCDKRYWGHTIYPGVTTFYHVLEKGHLKIDEYKTDRWWIQCPSWLANRVNAKPVRTRTSYHRDHHQQGQGSRDHHGQHHGNRDGSSSHGGSQHNQRGSKNSKNKQFSDQHRNSFHGSGNGTTSSPSENRNNKQKKHRFKYQYQTTQEALQKVSAQQNFTQNFTDYQLQQQQQNKQQFKEDRDGQQSQAQRMEMLDADLGSGDEDGDGTNDALANLDPNMFHNGLMGQQDQKLVKSFGQWNNPNQQEVNVENMVHAGVQTGQHDHICLSGSEHENDKHKKACSGKLYNDKNQQQSGKKSEGSQQSHTSGTKDKHHTNQSNSKQQHQHSSAWSQTTSAGSTTASGTSVTASDTTYSDRNDQQSQSAASSPNSVSQSQSGNQSNASPSASSTWTFSRAAGAGGAGGAGSSVAGTDTESDHGSVGSWAYWVQRQYSWGQQGQFITEGQYQQSQGNWRHGYINSQQYSQDSSWSQSGVGSQYFMDNSGAYNSDGEQSWYTQGSGGHGGNQSPSNFSVASANFNNANSWNNQQQGQNQDQQQRGSSTQQIRWEHYGQSSSSQHRRKGQANGMLVGHLTAFSARPHIVGDQVESRIFAMFAKLQRTAGLHCMPWLMAGGLGSGLRFFFGGDFAPIGEKKYNNFLEYQKLYPEFKFIFVGDNGQGDYYGAKYMLKNFSHIGVMEQVYIHLVQPKKDTYGLNENDIPDENCYFCQDYIDASIHWCIYKKIISVEAMWRVCLAWVDDFEKINSWNSFGVKEGKQKRWEQVDLLNTSVRRVNNILDFFSPNYDNLPRVRELCGGLQWIKEKEKKQFRDWEIQTDMDWFVSDAKSDLITTSDKIKDMQRSFNQMFDSMQYQVERQWTNLQSVVENNNDLQVRLQEKQQILKQNQSQLQDWLKASKLSQPQALLNLKALGQQDKVGSRRSSISSQHQSQWQNQQQPQNQQQIPTAISVQQLPSSRGTSQASATTSLQTAHNTASMNQVFSSASDLWAVGIQQQQQQQQRTNSHRRPQAGQSSDNLDSQFQSTMEKWSPCHRSWNTNTEREPIKRPQQLPPNPSNPNKKVLEHWASQTQTQTQSPKAKTSMHQRSQTQNQLTTRRVSGAADRQSMSMRKSEQFKSMDHLDDHAHDHGQFSPLKPLTILNANPQQGTANSNQSLLSWNQNWQIEQELSSTSNFESSSSSSQVFDGQQQFGAAVVGNTNDTNGNGNNGVSKHSTKQSQTNEESTAQQQQQNLNLLKEYQELSLKSALSHETTRGDGDQDQGQHGNQLNQNQTGQYQNQSPTPTQQQKQGQTQSQQTIQSPKTLSPRQIQQQRHSKTLWGNMSFNTVEDFDAYIERKMESPSACSPGRSGKRGGSPRLDGDGQGEGEGEGVKNEIQNNMKSQQVRQVQQDENAGSASGDKDMKERNSH